jgi:hypothetical protein
MHEFMHVQLTLSDFIDQLIKEQNQTLSIETDINVRSRLSRSITRSNTYGWIDPLLDQLNFPQQNKEPRTCASLLRSLDLVGTVHLRAL